jgi:hypothetical protein
MNPDKLSKLFAELRDHGPCLGSAILGIDCPENARIQPSAPVTDIKEIAIGNGYERGGKPCLIALYQERVSGAEVLAPCHNLVWTAVDGIFPIDGVPPHFVFLVTTKMVLATYLLPLFQLGIIEEGCTFAVMWDYRYEGEKKEKDGQVCE